MRPIKSKQYIAYIIVTKKYAPCDGNIIIEWDGGFSLHFSHFSKTEAKKFAKQLIKDKLIFGEASKFLKVSYIYEDAHRQDCKCPICLCVR